MKELIILSGKGGTGKTTVATAFLKLSKAKAYGDLDVDAPNLHLTMAQNKVPDKKDYFGLDKALIDQDLCTSCGQCEAYCRFDAISVSDNLYSVNNYYCEGCGVCEFVCPYEAIKMVADKAGDLMLYQEEDQLFSTGELKTGSGNTGLLVTEVKNQLIDAKGQLLIYDGSPGIGCPVIASLTGADMVLVVAEPSLSGISDMERILSTANHFNIKQAVCVNKYDVNERNTLLIEDHCKKLGIPFVGKIPYDENAVLATNKGQSIVDLPCPSGNAVRTIFKETINLLES